MTPLFICLFEFDVHRKNCTVGSEMEMEPLKSENRVTRVHILQAGSTFIEQNYRVTIEVVSNLPLATKQKFHFSMRLMY